MARESILKLVENIDRVAADQTYIKTSVEESREESREIRRLLSESASSLGSIATSIREMNKLVMFLLKWVVMPLAAMVFVLALLFAGVKFTEITNAIPKISVLEKKLVP